MQHARPPASATGQSPSDRHRRRRWLRGRFPPSPTAPMTSTSRPARSPRRREVRRQSVGCRAPPHRATEPNRSAARGRAPSAATEVHDGEETRTPGSPRGPRAGRRARHRAQGATRGGEARVGATRHRRHVREWRTRVTLEKAFSSRFERHRRNFSRTEPPAFVSAPSSLVVTPFGTGTGFGSLALGSRGEEVGKFSSLRSTRARPGGSQPPLREATHAVHDERHRRDDDE